MEDRAFLKAFFRQITDTPLESDDERYVPLYDNIAVLDSDPVALLSRAIEFSAGESVQLLSGYRGTGKTTELRRLETKLLGEAYKVISVDIDKYVNTSTPIDVSDFLMVIAGAFGEALATPNHLGKDATGEGYWARLSAFLTRTKIELPDVSAAGLKANLKSDPTFRQQLQGKMAGHLGALVQNVRQFLDEGVQALKTRFGDDTEVVLLVDSLEHIRGTFINATDVQQSVEALFGAHADKLKLPNLHVVYIVPPYLKVRAPNLGQLFGAGAVQVFPAVKVRGDDGAAHAVGLSSLKTLVARRGDWKRLLGSEAQLDRIIDASGGNIRDLLRLISEVILRARALPVSERTIGSAIDQIRTEFLPIADDDAVWLAQIAEEHNAVFEKMDKVPDLTRFFDSHLVLCYRDGPEWYDVHPLIREIVIKQAAEIEKRRKAAAAE